MELLGMWLGIINFYNLMQQVLYATVEPLSKGQFGTSNFVLNCP